jgi:hypothetical protein
MEEKEDKAFVLTPRTMALHQFADAVQLGSFASAAGGKLSTNVSPHVSPTVIEAS